MKGILLGPGDHMAKKFHIQKKQQEFRKTITELADRVEERIGTNNLNPLFSNV